MFFGLKKHKKALQKEYEKGQRHRIQLNFECDSQVTVRLKLMRMCFDCPLYVLAEHALELGLSEIETIMEDSTLTEVLQRHLVEGHMNVKDLRPMEKHVSQRATRVENARKLLALVESKGGSPQAVGEVLDRIIQEA